jgi:hypothetical protein
VATVLVASLDLHRAGGRPVPPVPSGDDAEMMARMLATPLTLPLLLVQVQERAVTTLG